MVDGGGIERDEEDWMRKDRSVKQGFTCKDSHACTHVHTRTHTHTHTCTCTHTHTRCAHTHTHTPHLGS